MAIEIVMPKLGWTMEEGTLVEWLKQDGDTVQTGDIMFTVESDKALNEVESFESGIFRIPANSDVLGKTVPVGTLLAYITQPGEALPSDQTTASEGVLVLNEAPVEVLQNSPASSPPPPITTEHSAAENGNGQHRLPNISPRARRVAGELGVEWAKLIGSGRSGRIVERDVRASLSTVKSTAPTQISPVAKRAAEGLGVDVAALAAQMPGQRITREHVERAIQTDTTSRPAKVTPSENRTAMPRLRQIIAERMAASAHTTAPVTLTTEVDASELVKLRKGLKTTGQSDQRPIPSYNDLLAKLVAEALVEHPQLNARIDGDEIVASNVVNMGFAVDTERGLIVPVIHDIRRKSIRQIAAEGIALVEQARNGSLRADNLSGGTFTITNLGMYEIDAFTPIINMPQCAILGVGRIVPKQVVIDADAERVAIRHMMFLSLTFDHRLVDGAPAARFLQHVKRFIEQPYLWLVN